MERFSSLRYKVHQSSNLEKDFPDLFRHAEFKKLIKRREGPKLIKYLAYMYDKNSELVQEFQSDLQSRKDAAATEAGFERRMDKWGQDLQRAMDIQDADVYNAILCFLKIQKHVVWTEIVITESELEDFQKLRLKPISTSKSKKEKDSDGASYSVNSAESDKDVYEAAKKKDTLMQACTIRVQALEILYDQFFGDSRKELQSVEFAEAITPETAERIMVEQ